MIPFDSPFHSLSNGLSVGRFARWCSGTHGKRKPGLVQGQDPWLRVSRRMASQLPWSQSNGLLCVVPLGEQGLLYPPQESRLTQEGASEGMGQDSPGSLAGRRWFFQQAIEGRCQSQGWAYRVVYMTYKTWNCSVSNDIYPILTRLSVPKL